MPIRSATCVKDPASARQGEKNFGRAAPRTSRRRQARRRSGGTSEGFMSGHAELVDKTRRWFLELGAVWLPPKTRTRIPALSSGISHVFPPPWQICARGPGERSPPVVARRSALCRLGPEGGSGRPLPLPFNRVGLQPQRSPWPFPRPRFDSTPSTGSSVRAQRRCEEALPGPAGVSPPSSAHAFDSPDPRRPFSVSGYCCDVARWTAVRTFCHRRGKAAIDGHDQHVVLRVPNAFRALVSRRPAARSVDRVGPH